MKLPKLTDKYLIKELFFVILLMNVIIALQIIFSKSMKEKKLYKIWDCIYQMLSMIINL